MKKYILLIIISNLSCFAQQTIPITNYSTSDLKNNNHIKDFTGVLDKFIGQWKWTDSNNPNTYFLVNLFKVEDWNPSNIDNFFEDKILGNYSFVENGQIVINTLSYMSFNDINSNEHPTIISNVDRPFFLSLSINMSDKIKGKTCYADFNIINPNSSTISATWKMYEREASLVGGNPIPIGFSIPNDVVLIKQ